MIDKVKFMETLRSVAEVAKVAEEPLTREEIISYFDDIELNDEQITMIFDYLKVASTESEVVEKSVEEEVDPNESEAGYDAFARAIENSKFLAMYLEDLAEIKTLSKSELQERYMRLLQGDESVIPIILDDWLMKVVEVAKTYTSYDVNMEDLIQEGNIGLLKGLNQLLGSKEHIDVEEYIKESVQLAMETFIDEENQEDDWEETIIAKTTLINEARKALAEENLTIPTVEELEEYTKIPKQEIEDIMRLLKEEER